MNTSGTYLALARGAWRTCVKEVSLKLLGMPLTGQHVSLSRYPYSMCFPIRVHSHMESAPGTRAKLDFMMNSSVRSSSQAAWTLWIMSSVDLAGVTLTVHANLSLTERSNDE